jgi:hypothetical protein
MANEGLRLSWWQVITLCIAISGSVYGTLARADNQIEKEIAEIKAQQEKKNDQQDKKLDKLMDVMNETNLELRGVVVLLKELTK